MLRTRAARHLYLVRHGQTEFNRQGRVQGAGVDSELNETGRQQAELLHQQYGHIPFGRLYASGLQRTQQTLEPFAQALGIRPEHRNALNEISWGTLEGQAASPEMRKAFHNTLQAWEQGQLDVALADGESPLEVAQRADQFIEELHDTWDGQPVLVCSHGRYLRILLCRLLGYPLSQMHLFVHENTGVNHLSRLMPDYYPLRLNDTSHLVSLGTVETPLRP